MEFIPIAVKLTGGLVKLAFATRTSFNRYRCCIKKEVLTVGLVMSAHQGWHAPTVEFQVKGKHIYTPAPPVCYNPFLL
jgi:hypothetical protein